MLGKKNSIWLPSRRRQRNFQIPMIIVLFSVGFILIGIALFSQNDDIQDPEPTGKRLIRVHAASTAENEDVANIPEPLKIDDMAEDVDVPQVEPTPSEPPMNAFSMAMLDLAQMPVAPGATAPQVGLYSVRESSIAYDPEATPEEIAAAQATTYVVVSGDVLGRIAKNHGCSIAQIQRANRMTDDQIRVGQKLLIPNCENGSEKNIQPLVQAPAAPVAKRGVWWKKKGVNTTALPKLMAAEGFKKPKKFMAFIIELTFDETRQVIVNERAFDYNGTSSKNTGWNPASTVKIFAAIGALKRIDELGFSSRAKITFHGKKTYTTTVSELIESAIINSNNIAYDRVVQLASFEKLHTEILTSRFGITQTALNKGYEISKWQGELGENPSLRISPAITISEGKKTTKLPAANSKAHSVCGSAACTSLQDLAESTRRLMLQEQLPENESFGLKNADLLMLRRAMRSPERQRGREMVDRFAAVFKDDRVKFYSKPGFSEDWFTDNVYIFDPRSNQAWIVVMSGYPGRSSLNSASTVIAKIISSGKLRKTPQ